jgi:hypothetical protein
MTTPKTRSSNKSNRRRRRQVRRVLYRNGLTNDEVARLVAELGPVRLLGVIDRFARPSPPFTLEAAE